MIIEETTDYAFKLKHIGNLNFDRIRAFAQDFVSEYPQELVDDIFFQLNHGLDLLQNEPQMFVYLHSYGKMHEAKLNCAFEQLPDAFLQQPEIRIVDYGCGQAIGTMCYADFLAEHGLSQTIKSVTLIEPSEICLKRAALHVSQFFPDAEIHTVCKTFNYLTDDDIANTDDIPTLHILSNVLDIQEFDLEDFAILIDNNLSNYNQFVCVGPYFNYSDKDERMTRFAEMMKGNITYSKIFEKGVLNADKSWTAQILCLNVFKEKISLPNIDTDYTDDEIENGIRDDYDVVYSEDREKLIKSLHIYSKKHFSSYSVKYGTKIICDNAFACCPLKEISIPDTVIAIGNKSFYDCFNLLKITIPKSVINIGNEAFRECKDLRKVTISNSVIKIGYDAFRYCNALREINIPSSVISIGGGTFEGCENLQEINIPDSIKIIGANPFLFCKKLSKIISSRFVIQDGLLVDNKQNIIISCFSKEKSIVIPDTITSIGGRAFAFCSSLEYITIPESVKSIGNAAFNYCRSLKQITIPYSVENIDTFVFSGCKSLSRVDILGPITTIGKSTFDGCESLQQINIPESVTEIGNEAFSFCKSLKQIVIPKSVRSIGCAVFKDCDSLQRIIIPKDSIEDFTKMFKSNLFSKDGLENLRFLDKLVEEK